MVVPLFIGMVINTFFPTLLQIGGFTQALSGVGYPTVLGMYLFTVGTKMTIVEWYAIPSGVSLGVVGALLAASIVASLWKARLRERRAAGG